MFPPPCRQPPHEVVASTSSRLRQQLARSRLPPHGNQFAPLKQEYKLQAFPAGQFSPHCAILATGAPPLPYSSQHTENSGTSCQDMAAYKASGKPVIPPQTSSSRPARHISSMWQPAVPAERTQPRSSRQHWKLVCALPLGRSMLLALIKPAAMRLGPPALPGQDLALPLPRRTTSAAPPPKDTPAGCQNFQQRPTVDSRTPL